MASNPFKQLQILLSEPHHVLRSEGRVRPVELRDPETATG
jgi:hypothetical protein